MTNVGVFGIMVSPTTERDSMLDARGIPTNECPSCASTLFTVQVSFDDNYLISGYLLDAKCAYCETLITCPTPLDHAEYDAADVRWM